MLELILVVIGNLVVYILEEVGMNFPILDLFISAIIPMSALIYRKRREITRLFQKYVLKTLRTLLIKALCVVNKINDRINALK